MFFTQEINILRQNSFFDSKKQTDVRLDAVGTADELSTNYSNPLLLHRISILCDHTLYIHSIYTYSVYSFIE